MSGEVKASSDRPSAALAQFAADELNLAFKIMLGTGTQNAGSPGLHPFVALKLGPLVRRTTLHYFTAPELIRFCPRLAQEHSEAQMISAVCDGYLNVSGTRRDALLIRVQERDSDASYIFGQCYQPPRATQRFSLLGNWMLLGTDVSLFPPPLVGAENPVVEVQQPAPSETEGRFAAEILEQTLLWVRIKEEPPRNSEPLFSPSLHLRVGDQTIMNRFPLGIGGNQLWAEANIAEAIRSEKTGEASLVAFVWDEVTTVNLAPARSLRFRVQAKNTKCSWMFAQAYPIPRMGAEFATAGPLNRIAAAESMFPES